MTVAAATDDAQLTAKGRATRRRIVGAAAGAMYERGVARTSTEDVRIAADVSSSQLYHYFRDKQDLVRAVIARQIEVVMSMQEPALLELDSFESLAAWRDMIVELQARRSCVGGCPIGALAGELADTDDIARRDLAAGFERWEAAIRAGLSTMRERGELTGEADPDFLALATLASLQGGLALARVRRDVTPLATALDAAIALIRTFATSP